jgi:MFS family permease
MPKPPRNVVILGLVSFLNDAAAEMVVPMLPLLVTATGAGALALGFMEGVADAIAALLKLWAGRRSDRLGGRRKPLTILGYTLSNVIRPAFALAGSWLTLLVLRAVDRIGKGLRSAPRDALVADSTPAVMMGAAYGLHRALDNGGAVLGSLIAAAVLAITTLSPAEIVLWSTLPGLACVALMVWGVREVNTPARMPPDRPQAVFGVLTPRLRDYLGVLVLVNFGQLSELFILLRAVEIGLTPVQILLLWAAFNLAKSLTALRGGVLSDSHGRSRMLTLGWSAVALGALGLALASDASTLWMATTAYGLITGFAEGPERALIGDLASADARGTAFGWYHLTDGLASIPSALAFGFIWQRWGAPFAFFFSAVMMSLAILAFRRWQQRHRPI